MAKKIFNLSHTEIFPIMGNAYNAQDFDTINLDEDHLAALKELNSSFSPEKYIKECHDSKSVKWLTGGYLEKRSLYQSELFNKSSEPIRDIHLGVDIWGQVHSPIYAPLKGRIHSYANNNRPLDYGYTLILEHLVEEVHFYTLYGHLSSNHWDNWQVDRVISAGDCMADIGPEHENGGWTPHLHFQIILDMEGGYGDYPGVCSELDLDFYRANSPDANLLIRREV